MINYNIYYHPAGKHEAVKQGWSWPGFFFVFIWAFIKNMTALGVVVLAIYIGLGVIEDIVDNNTKNSIETVYFVENLIISLVFGYRGNDWRERNLRRRGYELQTMIEAQSPEGAIGAFLKKCNANKAFEGNSSR